MTENTATTVVVKTPLYKKIFTKKNVTRGAIAIGTGFVIGTFIRVINNERLLINVADHVGYFTEEA